MTSVPDPPHSAAEELVAELASVDASIIPRRAHRLGTIYGVMAVLLIPWIIYLAITLPERSTAHHWDVTWVGFDCLLVFALARTAWFARHLRPEIILTANAAATLLIIDAWFDLTTAPNRGELIQSVVLAVFVEIPAAVFSLYLAGRGVARLAEAVAHSAVEVGAEAEADAVAEGQPDIGIDPRPAP